MRWHDDLAHHVVAIGHCATANAHRAGNEIAGVNDHVAAHNLGFATGLTHRFTANSLARRNGFVVVGDAANSRRLCKPDATAFPFGGFVRNLDLLSDGFVDGWHHFDAFACRANHYALFNFFEGAWSHFKTRTSGACFHLLGDGLVRDLHSFEANRFWLRQNLLAHRFVCRRNDFDALRGRTRFHLLSHGLVRCWNHFQALTGRANFDLLGYVFVGRWNDFKTLAFRLNQNAFADRFVGCGNRLFAETSGLGDNSFSQRLVGRWNSDLALVLRTYEDLFGHALVRRWNSDRTLVFWAHKHLLGHRFVGCRNGLVTLVLRAYEHLLGYRLVRRWNRSVALVFRAYEHLLGHSFERGRDDFKTFCRADLNHLLSFGFVARWRSHSCEALTRCARDHRCRQTYWAWQILAEVVVAQLHGGAHRVAVGGEVNVDGHVRAVGHVFADELAAHAITFAGTAYAQVTRAARVSGSLISKRGRCGRGGDKIRDFLLLYAGFTIALKRRMLRERLVKLCAAIGDCRIAFCCSVVAHITVVIGGLRCKCGKAQQEAGQKTAAKHHASNRLIGEAPLHCFHYLSPVCGFC